MAPLAIFHHFNSFSIILLVLVRTIITTLAIRTCHGNSFTHSIHLTQLIGYTHPYNILMKYNTVRHKSQQNHLKRSGFSDEKIITHPFNHRKCLEKEIFSLLTTKSPCFYIFPFLLLLFLLRHHILASFGSKNYFIFFNKYPYPSFSMSFFGMNRNAALLMQ